jgi:hypothetical protein
VTVEKMLYQSGTIEVEADAPDEAIAEVEAMMQADEPLQTNDPRIAWDEPEYEDFSFVPTGDVDEAADQAAAEASCPSCGAENPDRSNRCGSFATGAQERPRVVVSVHGGVVHGAAASAEVSLDVLDYDNFECEPDNADMKLLEAEFEALPFAVY